MKKKQRIRYLIAAATRRNVLGVNRTAELTRLIHSHLFSTDLTNDCWLRKFGFGYSGGDYWN